MPGRSSVTIAAFACSALAIVAAWGWRGGMLVYHDGVGVADEETEPRAHAP